MQRLAAAGLMFDRAFVASPSCAPSRAALLTGLMPARNGAEANHSKPRAELKKLPAYLKELGYEVVSFGKVSHYQHTRRLRLRSFRARQVSRGHRDFCRNQMAAGAEERQATLHFLRHELAACAVAGRSIRISIPRKVHDSTHARRHAANARSPRPLLCGGAHDGRRTRRRLQRRERSIGTKHVFHHDGGPRRAVAVWEMELLRRRCSHADDCGVAGENRGGHPHQRDGELDRYSADAGGGGGRRVAKRHRRPLIRAAFFAAKRRSIAIGSSRRTAATAG